MPGLDERVMPPSSPGISSQTPGSSGGGDKQPTQRAGPNSSQNRAGDSIILEEEIDPNYEPTEDEVIEYAKWLGMDLDAEKKLWWIAREGLKAPLPKYWKPCKTTDTEEIYYFNFATGASTWDHPCDEYCRNLYEEEKKKLGNCHQTQGKKPKSKYHLKDGDLLAFADASFCSTTKREDIDFLREEGEVTQQYKQQALIEKKNKNVFNLNC